MGLASSGVNQAIDMADNASSLALAAVREVEDNAVAAGHGALKAGDKTFDAIAEEVESARKRFVDSLRKLAGEVTAPLP